MEFYSLFFKGALLGFSIAAPVGPIGILCIRQTLMHGRLIGFVSGAGAATADGIYGLVAAFGLAASLKSMVSLSLYIHWLGSAFLLCLGLKIYRNNEGAITCKEGNAGIVRAYVTTFGLTMTNPMTILSFAAVFAGMGMGITQAGYAGAGTLAGGVFIGSLLWWLLLSCSINILKSSLPPHTLRYINKASGALLLGCACYSFWSGV